MQPFFQWWTQNTTKIILLFLKSVQRILYLFSVAHKEFKDTISAWMRALISYTKCLILQIGEI